MAFLKIIYKDTKVEGICQDLNKATKYFGGNKEMAKSLLARINALKQAENIKDIIYSMIKKYEEKKKSLRKK